MSRPLAGVASASLPDAFEPWFALVERGYYFAGCARCAAVLLMGCTS